MGPSARLDEGHILQFKELVNAVGRLLFLRGNEGEVRLLYNTDYRS